MSAGAGFGQPKRRLKLAYGGSSQSPIEQQKRWEVAYKAYISRMGKYLTAMSWEGHSQMGRGAIYANIQAREPIKRGERAQTWQKFGGIPTLYVPLEQYQVKSANTEQESKDLQQIIARIENYNAEREFVVVLEAAGLMGTDVVRPSLSPPEMHRILGQKDGFGVKNSNAEEDRNIGVLSDYWRNPGSQANGDDIDMSSLIMDALDTEDSVIDITNYLNEIVDTEDDEPRK